MRVSLSVGRLYIGGAWLVSAREPGWARPVEIFVGRDGRVSGHAVGYPFDEPDWLAPVLAAVTAEAEAMRDEAGEEPALGHPGSERRREWVDELVARARRRLAEGGPC